MAVRWSRWSPQFALIPAVAVTVVAFIGAIVWTIWLSLTNSKRFPDYGLQEDLWKQYGRLFKDGAWIISLKNMVILGLGSCLAIIFGFLLAALIDREKRGEGIFRTIFLYPLAVSLIVTGVAWRWKFNPSFGLQNFFHSIDLTWINFNWLASADTAMYGIILASVWQSTNKN